MGLLERWRSLRGQSKKPPSEVSPPVVLPPSVLALQSRRDELNSLQHDIHVNSAAECIDHSAALRGWEAGRALGLVALDNANDSNPYCLITRGPAAGKVVHWFHDDEPEIEFGDLAAFEQFLRDLRAGAAKRWWEDDVERAAIGHADQAGLAAAIEQLSAIYSDEAETCLMLYLQLLAGEHESLLRKLCAHPDMYVREAVAGTIAAGRVTDASALLLQLAEDDHAQVRQAALRALRKTS